MVEGGITALLGIFVTTIGVMLVLTKSGVSRGWSYFVLLLPLSFHTQVELPFYMSAMHWLMFMTLLAVPLKLLSTQRNNLMTIYAKKLSAISLLVISLILMAALAHTIRANWDFVAFYKGQQKENPLPVAKKNPFLSEQAQWIDMSALMYTSIQHDLRENVAYYAQWGEKLLETNPDIDLYAKLLSAYEYLADQQAYCETVQEGSSIYPQSEKMQMALLYCQN
jgi:O-antigen polymerase